MSFTSTYFLPFVAIILCIYYLAAKKVSVQNSIMLAASIFFYAYGHIHYFFIWAGLSVFTFLMGLTIERFKGTKLLSALAGVSSLVIFFLLIKYSKMFFELAHVALPSQLNSLQLLLPVGLSFYSFTSIGYLIDVYQQRISACKNPLQFFAYSSFFPQILSGPISFADIQLPQYATARKFNLDNFKTALPYFVWGMFKKVVISNMLSKPVAYIFAQHENQHSITLFIGLILYSIQIYADFSGYSDMAYAIGRFFGISIPINFKMPYFSSNIADYWRRWHSSLSKWLGRYIYVPLGGNKKSFSTTLRNIIIIFAISGLWHGADTKYVIWGLLNGLFFIIYLINEKSKETSYSISNLVLNKALAPTGMVLTFLAVTFARVYFRSETVGDANNYLIDMFNNTGNNFSIFGLQFLLYVALFMGFEWFQRNKKTALDFDTQKPIVQIGMYLAVVTFIIYFMQQPQTTEHIYFKF